jgi:hypothetical protein
LPRRYRGLDRSSNATATEAAHDAK